MKLINLRIFSLLALLLAPVGSSLGEEEMWAALRARMEAPTEKADDAEGSSLGTPGLSLFSMTGADNASCVRSISDMNGDGRDEVLVGIDESQTDNVFLLDGASRGTATVLWTVETMDGVSGGSPYGDQSLVSISDSDGDGAQNLLLGTAWGGRTAYNLNGVDGSTAWKLDTYLENESGWVYSLAEMNDMTGDGVPEVAFGVGSMNDGVYLVDGAGDGGPATVLWRFQALDGVLSVRNIGDVNGDGDDDVLAAIGDEGLRLVCLSGGAPVPTGQILWQYLAGDTVFAAGVVPDFTGDGIQEAIAVTWAAGGSAVRCLNGATGDLLWSSSTIFDPAMMVDVLADVTGDGVDEVVVSSWENAAIVLNGADGSEVWKTTVGTTNGGDVWASRAIGDLNDDGFEDVIAGSFDYSVYALNGLDGEIFWSFDTGNRVFSVFPSGDLDGDGRPEVLVGTQDTNSNVVFHALSGGSVIPMFADGFESGDTTFWSTVVGGD